MPQDVVYSPSMKKKRQTLSSIDDDEDKLVSVQLTFGKVKW